MATYPRQITPLPSQFHTDLRRAGRSLRRTLVELTGQSANASCDPFQAAKLLGITVDKTATTHRGGFLMHRGDHWFMELSGVIPSYRQRFTCCHEIGHFLLMTQRKRLLRQLCARYPTIDSGYIEERACNRLAVEMLLPPSPLIKTIATTGLNLAVFKSFLAEYNCSIQTTSLRLTELAPHWVFVISLSGYTPSRGHHLSVSWSSGPESIFVPMRKVFPKGSSIYKAYSTNCETEKIETRPFKSLKGSYFTESMPIGKKMGVFTIMHLNTYYQLSLPLSDDTNPDDYAQLHMST